MSGAMQATAAPAAQESVPPPRAAPKKKEPRKPWFWRGMWHNKSLLSSVFYTAGIAAFYLFAQGYLPQAMKAPFTEYVLPDIAVMGIAVGAALFVAGIYGLIEFADTQTANTPTPWEHAVESLVSQFPVYAFVFVLTSWGWGAITVSWFQWLVGVILFAPVVLDNLGFTAIIAQRLYLTDELKQVK